MLSTKRTRIAFIAGFTVVMLSMVMVGCGENSDTSKDYGVVIKRENTQKKSIEQPAVAAVEQPAATVEEPPREVTYEEAEAAYMDRNYYEAVDLFENYCDHRPGNPWGFYMLGLSAWKAGDNGRAEEAFEIALDLNPQHVKSMLNLSRVLLETDRPDEALGRIDESLHLDPESNAGYRLKGRALRQLGRTDEAIEAYRTAIRIDDRDAWSMNNLGLIFIEEGRYDEALPPLARAVELKDDAKVFYNNLGITLERSGRYRAAEQAYTTAVDIDESYDKAYANMIRIAEVNEDPGLEPVDLVAVAQSFVDRIETWKIAVADTASFDSVPSEADSIVVGIAGVVSDADTIQSGNDR